MEQACTDLATAGVMVSAVAYGGDLTFLQITFGYIVGRFLIIHVLMPLYFRGEAFTAYQVLESHFGTLSRRAASSLFLVTRNVSDALRLFLTALVLEIVLGLDLTVSVLVLGAITIVYTLVGGAKSVIWNDCIQFVIYMLGAAVAFAIIVQGVGKTTKQLNTMEAGEFIHDVAGPLGHASEIEMYGTAVVVDAGPRDNLAAWAALKGVRSGDVLVILGTTLLAMGQQDLVQSAEAQTTAQQLALGALAAVHHEPIFLVHHHSRRQATPYGRCGS